MYFMDAIQYPFNSQGWFKKLVIAFLLTLIPIINIFGAIVLLGYTLSIVRSVMQGETDLPEYDFGDNIGKGLMALLGGLVYAIPLIILLVLINLILPVSYDTFGDPQMNPLALLLTMLLALLWGPIIVVAVVRYAIEDSTGALFDFMGNINTVVNNPGPTVMYYVNALILGLIVGVLAMVGFFLLVIPGLIVTTASTFMQGYLYAAYARDLGLGMRKRKVHEAEY